MKITRFLMLISETVLFPVDYVIPFCFSPSFFLDGWDFCCFTHYEVFSHTFFSKMVRRWFRHSCVEAVSIISHCGKGNRSGKQIWAIYEHD